MLEFAPYPLLTGIGLLVILLVGLKRGGRGTASLFCFSLCWLYLLLVASMIIFPIPLPSSLGGARQPAAHILSRINLVPFSFGGLFDLSTGVIFQNLGGNILLTLPFGFGINFIARLQARRLPWIALGVGLGLETAQLAVSLATGVAYRGIDVNDVLFNAAGVLIGYGFFRIFTWLFRTLSRRLGIESGRLKAYFDEIAG